MNALRHIGFRGRVMLLATAPTVLVAIALVWYMTSVRFEDLDQAVRDRGNAIAQELAAASVYGVFSGNLDSLGVLARSVLTRTDVISVTIRDQDGQVLLRAAVPELSEYSDPAAVATAKLLSFSAPVRLANLQIEDDPSALLLGAGTEGASPSIGSLSILIRDKISGPRQVDILRKAMLIVLLVAAGAALIAAWLGRNVTEPIGRLTKAVRRLSEGDLATTVIMSSGGEIGTLETGFNAMAGKLNAHHDELNQRIEEATGELWETLNELEMRNIELNLIRRDAEQASRVKSDFLARMSHEIRTPMNGVIGFTRLLAHTDLSAEQRQYLSTIAKSASSLVEVINDILDFSKFEVSGPNLKTTPFSLRTCFQDSLALLRPAAHEKHLELVMLIYSDVPDRLVGDPTRIRQILTNLVGNAIKFTQEGEVAVRVMLEDQGPEACTIGFTVSDTGIGIAPNARQRIFDPFHQFSSSTGPVFGGTGLGLTISRKLAESMGGGIVFDSKQGQGSTFTVTLKLPLESNADQDTTSSALAGRRVLLADTHPLSRLALGHQLQSWAIEVESVEDPARIGQALAGPVSVDALVLGFSQKDLRSDRLSSILSTTHPSGIPCLVLISASAQNQLDQVVELGATSCLPKPIASDQLYSSLCSLLSIEHTLASDEMPGEDVPSCHRRRFLVVDDNDINRLLIATLLSRTGAEVTEAGSGEQALTEFAGNDFALIFMDVHMPGLNGLETVAHIRQQEAPGTRVPIIALTADILSATRKEVLLAGMDDFVAKPIDEQTLWTIVRKHLPEQAASHHAGLPGPPVGTKPKENGTLAREMHRRLLAELPAAHRVLQDACRRSDWQAVGQQAHRLRGSALYCGCPELNQLLGDVEQASTDSQHPDLTPLMAQVDQEVERLLGGGDRPPTTTSGSGV